MEGLPILSIIMLSPLAACIVLMFVKEESIKLIRGIAVSATSISLMFALYILFAYDKAKGGYQFVEKIEWVKSLGISYHLGVDGISVAMVVLTSFVIFTGVFVSWVGIKHRIKEHYIFLLLLVSGVFGVFTSLDLVFFYLFYELAVIPMYPLIGIWGSANREYATMKLTLYLSFGAVFALLGILSIYFTAGQMTGQYTFDMTQIGKLSFEANYQKWVFLPMLFGFGVLVPLAPFHSWSPIGHAAAPSAVSMLHAGVLMKLGAYGIIRIAMGLLPEGAQFWMPVVAVLCLINIFYGGVVAMTRKDMKFMIGYSSSSHMGYVLLGMATLNYIGMNGAVLLMFAHGIMTALAFALIGYVYDQAHTRMAYDFSGLAHKMPFIAVAFAVMGFASSGLPGLANFVSELMIFIGAFRTYPFQTVIAVFGIIITATYMLRALRNVFFCQSMPEWEHLKDATTFVERFPYIVLIAVLFIVGFYPAILIDVINTGVVPLVDKINGVSTIAKAGM
ncbi:MAG: NADH dehydrogenase [Deltaproteobacteria bacterium GWC2_42_11]|nr:MAG: NADH dehydrogenase [Deltaproteobacteria bacterium GWC2_42_11]HBO84062.1 NADH-quinone oxidoreductase subunit M [Deltaproteobacteria bacterium]